MADDAPTPQQCAPCRGTGRLISRLGGEEREIACPWCDGGGVVIAAHNAQEHAPSGS